MKNGYVKSDIILWIVYCIFGKCKNIIIGHLGQFLDRWMKIGIFLCIG
jgi:hypothetical protein